MKLTGKQAYVLENLDRVRAHAYLLTPKKKRSRYQLDGWDCTQQIVSLTVKNLVTIGWNGVVRSRDTYVVQPADASRSLNPC